MYIVFGLTWAFGGTFQYMVGRKLVVICSKYSIFQNIERVNTSVWMTFVSTKTHNNRTKMLYEIIFKNIV